jgi:MoxR-like ATPase
MMKVLVEYPSEEEEFVIVDRVTGAAEDEVAAVASPEQLTALQRECRSVFVEPALIQYAVRLAVASRQPERFDLPELARYISYGASPPRPHPSHRGGTGPGAPPRANLCPPRGRL